ncbi:MAG: chalcone isomerase family protein [Proteobacteria bacterium]|nr:chalcone isomerase family protein [Pseudomonadota bacterium]
MRMFIFFTLLLIGLPSYAKDISGVMVNDTLQTEDGTTLHLNGAGIRSKFFIDVYIASLYMEKPSAVAAEVIGDKGKKRIVMHFLHSEVSKDKLVDAWNDGFKENNSAGELAKLQERINQFNALFVDVKKNDVIVLDYAPATGTVVTIKGEKKGAIPGSDFNDALLKIWLGDNPVTSSLKDKLLSYKK